MREDILYKFLSVTLITLGKARHLVILYFGALSSPLTPPCPRSSAMLCNPFDCPPRQLRNTRYTVHSERKARVLDLVGPQSGSPLRHSLRAGPSGAEPSKSKRFTAVGSSRAGRRRAAQGGTGRHRAAQGGAGRRRAAQGGTGRHRAAQGGTGRRRTAQGGAGRRGASRWTRVAQSGALGEYSLHNNEVPVGMWSAKYLNLNLPSESVAWKQAQTGIMTSGGLHDP